MYPSDLTNAEWAVLAPLFPDPGYDIPKNGRPRDWSYRLILNAIFYLNKTASQLTELFLPLRLTFFHRGSLSLERCRIPVSIIPVIGRS